MRPARVHSVRAFTLVEMLVAIAIFGIMATIGYGALDGALNSRDRVSDEFRRWRDIARAVAQIERDLQAITPRPVRESSGIEGAPIVGVARALRGEAPLLAFTRRGDADAEGNPGVPRRTGYRVTDGVLERLTWPVLDQAPRTTPSATPLLVGVRALNLRYRDPVGRWWSAWPPEGMPVAEAPAADGRKPRAVGPLPAQVDVVIEFAGGQRIQRIIPLAAGARAS